MVIMNWKEVKTVGHLEAVVGVQGTTAATKTRVVAKMATILV